MIVIINIPQFLVNGVMKPDGADYNAKQWKTFIDNLINGTMYMQTCSVHDNYCTLNLFSALYILYTCSC